jgi:hypothetical protein
MSNFWNKQNASRIGTLTSRHGHYSNAIDHHVRHTGQAMSGRVIGVTLDNNRLNYGRYSGIVLHLSSPQRP